MTENKRRWFQIHLSTALLIVFVIGLLMLVNFQFETKEPILYYHKREIASRIDNWMFLPSLYGPGNASYYSDMKAFGWPLPLAARHNAVGKRFQR